MKKTYLGLAVLLMVALTVLSGANFSQFSSVAAAQSATPTPAAVAAPVIVPPQPTPV